MTCFYFPIGMLGEWQKWAVAVFAVGKKVLLQSQWEELELAGSEILSSNGDEDHGNKMEMFPQEITFSDQHGKGSVDMNLLLIVNWKAHDQDNAF